MRRRRLLSHLAQFSSFSKQGELLCTAKNKKAIKELTEKGMAKLETDRL